MSGRGRTRREWREAAWEARPYCMICGCYCPREQATVDHIVALADGGPDDESNWQLAHGLCNSQKGSVYHERIKQEALERMKALHRADAAKRLAPRTLPGMLRPDLVERWEHLRNAFKTLVEEFEHDPPDRPT